MSFQQGLSGLNGAASALNVIGNNVANASTVGFKGANTQFGDMYAASLGMVGSSQIGIGVNVGAVAQQFTQGNLTTTNNALDLALNGGGFFRVSNNGEMSYTRNGQFHLDKDGYVVNDQKLRLTGYPAAPNGLVTTSSPVELQLSASQMAPRATSDPLSGNLTATLNLDSRETVPTVTTFDYQNPQSYNFSTALSVYDSLGNPHNLTTFYVLNTPTAPAGNEWTVYATLDGANPQALAGNLIFDTSGNLDPASALHTLPTWNLTTGATTPWSPGSIDYAGTTQYGSDSSVDDLTQDGYPAGNLASIGVSADGIILGRYSNGQSRQLGQVVLATFANPNGLFNLGNNHWSLTAESGPELVGQPMSGGRGVIQSSTVEDSNIDLTKALVDMITAQRNYQANAQTIKTQDQVMQTLVNLR